MKNTNPYMGPQAFDREHAPYFFGRDKEIRELLNLLIGERLVLLYSPSGAGKTSLIQAALIPRLEKEGQSAEEDLEGDVDEEGAFRVWPVIRVGQHPWRPLRPIGNRYIFSMIMKLEEAWPEEQRRTPEELINLTLSQYVKDRQDKFGSPDYDVFIFDQFEEILSLDPTDIEAKRDFFTQLGDFLKHRQRFALFAMREEYLGGLDTYRHLIPTQLSTAYHLDLLGKDEALMAIREPAREAKGKFAEAAANKLVDDLRKVKVQKPDGAVDSKEGYFIEPVLLQVVCYDLWERCPGGRIGLKEVKQFGDVTEVLARYYGEKVERVALEASKIKKGKPIEIERRIRGWFERQLITPQGIRRQVLLDKGASAGLDNELIDQLEDAHLIRKEQQRGATWYELAHDRLIEPVRDDNVEWNRRHPLGTLLGKTAILWERQGEIPGLLLDGEALNQAKQEAAEYENELTQTQRKFLNACDRKILYRQKKRRNLIIGSVAIILLLLLFSLLALNTSYKKAESRRLAWEAHGKLTSDPGFSITLALKAFEKAETDKAINALNLALAGSWERMILVDPELKMTNQAHSDWVIGVRFVDENTLVTASKDGTIKVWDIAKGKILKKFGEEIKVDKEKRGEEKGFRSLALSHDKNRVATGTLDGTVTIWNLKEGNKEKEKKIFDKRVPGVAFSPNDKWIASASWDNKMAIWEIDSSREPEIFKGKHKEKGKEKEILCLAFSKDGWLVTGGGDTRFRVWENASGAGALFNREKLDALKAQNLREVGHEDWVMALALNPQDDLLATGSADETVKIWDTKTFSLRYTLLGHHNSIFGLAFNPDGTHLATAGADGMLKIWEVKSWEIKSCREIQTLEHRAPLFAAAFSPGGGRVATAGWDGKVTVWELHVGPVLGVAFEAGSNNLITACADGKVKGWGVNEENKPTLLGNFKGKRLRCVAFSPDAKWLATAERTALHLWRAYGEGKDRKYQESGSLKEPIITDNINSLTFDLKSRRVAATMDDKHVILWEVESKEKPLKFDSGHELNASAVAFHPDGKRIATGGWDGKVKLWELSDLKKHKDEWGKDRKMQILALLFSHEGYLLIGSFQQKLAVWNPDKNSKTPLGDLEGVRCMTFSGDGKKLAMAGLDRVVEVWDWENRKRIHKFELTGDINQVAFSPDGTKLGVACDNQRHYIYFLNLQELRKLAKPLGRALTEEEIQKYQVSGR